MPWIHQEICLTPKEWFFPSPLSRPQSWDLIYSNLEEFNIYIISKSIQQQSLTPNHSSSWLSVPNMYNLFKFFFRCSMWRFHGNLHEMGKINFSPGDSSVRLSSFSFARRSAPLKQFLLEGSDILSQGYSSMDT